MILPIHTFGLPTLREETVEVEEDSGELQQLIDDMLETMDGAAGVGLAAPQVGRTERLFVVDLSKALEDEEGESDAATAEEPMVFINPSINVLQSEQVPFEEGCLSIPDVREIVVRPELIEIEYLDRGFELQVLRTGGLLSRVAQHEFDHLNGILFVDRLTPLKRTLVKRRLREMARGDVEADYPIVSPSGSKTRSAV